MTLEAVLTIGAEAATEQGFMFEPMNFVSNLYYMGVGMAGIMIVIGVIIGLTALLNAMTKGK